VANQVATNKSYVLHQGFKARRFYWYL